MLKRSKHMRPTMTLRYAGMGLRKLVRRFRFRLLTLVKLLLLERKVLCCGWPVHSLGSGCVGVMSLLSGGQSLYVCVCGCVAYTYVCPTYAHIPICRVSFNCKRIQGCSVI